MKNDNVTTRPKRPLDFNQLAAQIVAEAVGDAEPEFPEIKNPILSERGRKGGAKGGEARAKRLTSEERKTIAQNAAIARWGS